MRSLRTNDEKVLKFYSVSGSNSGRKREYLRETVAFLVGDSNLSYGRDNYLS